MYQALYRKYRPRFFEDVVGQAHITETLRRQIASGRTSHAYLFVGTRGTGKTTCAKILSRALNCEHPKNGDPCNECPSCLGIENGSVLDVVEIDAASNNGVDNIRAIRDEAIFSPASVQKRVYIIDEVHMLSTSAFNALLKILEEPPEHLVFILATTEIRKIPATILSRCQRYSFRRIMPDDIMARLNYVASAEGLELSPSAAALLARLADGSMRDALSLLDQCASGTKIDESDVLSAIGLSASGDTAELFRRLSSGDTSGGLELFSRLYLGGMDPSALLSALLSMCRDMLILKVAPQNGAALISGACGSDALASLSASVSPAALVTCSDTLQDAVTSMNIIKDRRTAAELALIKLSGILAGAAPQVYAPAPVFAPAPSPVPVSEPKLAAPAPQSAPAPDNDPVPWEDIPEPPKAASAPSPDPAPISPENDPFMPKRVRDAMKLPTNTEAAPEKSDIPAPASATSDNGWWQRTLAAAEKDIDHSVLPLLSDSAHVLAEADEFSVTVFAKNDFVLMMIDTPGVKNALKAAAEKALGRSVVIKTAKGLPEQAAPSIDKLAELERFGNIKFE